MSIIENFLVNTNNFESIIQTLMGEENVPAKITDSYFKSLGFQNPSDLLVIHLLKGLDILEEDGSTTQLFSEFMHPETTRMALAKGIVKGYEDLFKKNSEVHKLETEELQEVFSNLFQGKKTDLILKYMTNTFRKLVSYAGLVNIENTLIHKNGQKDSASALEIVQEVAEIHKNGNYTTNGSSTAKQEIKSNISFEELVGLSAHELSDTTPSTPSKPAQPSTTPPQQANSDHSDDDDSNSTVLDSDQTDGDDDMDVKEMKADNPVSENIISEPVKEPVNENVDEPKEMKQDENIFEDFFTQDVSPEIKNEAEKEEDTIPIPQGNALKEADEKVKKAFIKKADLLYKLDRHEDALPTMDKIIDYFEQSSEPFLKEAVSKAVIRRAMILCKLQKFDQALPALDKVISKYGNSDNKEFYEQASAAMLYKAQIMESTNQLDQALPLFNSIVERLGNSTNPKIKGQVDSIYLKRLDILLADGNDSNVLHAADQLIERFRDRDDNLQHLEEAMFRKAEILEKMNKDEEALRAYSEFLEKFGNKVSTV